VQVNGSIQSHIVSSFEVWGWLIPPTVLPLGEAVQMIIKSFVVGYSLQKLSRSPFVCAEILAIPDFNKTLLSAKDLKIADLSL
jgi:hypothetical protein